MNAREHFKVAQKIIQIKGRCLSCKRGKLRYRALTTSEAEELALLQARLSLSIDPDEWDLFSRVIKSGGGTVIEQLPHRIGRANARA